MEGWQDQIRGMRVLVVALLSLAAALLIAACGGSGSDSTSGSTSEGTTASAPVIPKAELIKKADAICRKTDEVQRKAFNAYSVKNKLVLEDSPEMRKVMKTMLLPPIEVALEEIAALGMPVADRAEVTRIITGWERALDSSFEDPSLVLGIGEGPFTKPDKLAAKYGFKDCNQVL